MGAQWFGACSVDESIAPACDTAMRKRQAPRWEVALVAVLALAVALYALRLIHL
jgi:hypothetical protein